MGHLDRIALAKMTGKSVVKFVALVVVACTLLSGQKQFVEAAGSETPSTSSRTGVSNAAENNDLVSPPEEFKQFLNDLVSLPEKEFKQIVMAKKVYYDTMSEDLEAKMEKNVQRELFFHFLIQKLYDDDEQAKEEDYKTESDALQKYINEVEKDAKRDQEEFFNNNPQARKNLIDFAKKMYFQTRFGEFGEHQEAFDKALNDFDFRSYEEKEFVEIEQQRRQPAIVEVAPAVTLNKKLQAKQRQRRARRQRQRPSNGIKHKKRGKAKTLGHILQKHGKSKKPTS